MSPRRYLTSLVDVFARRRRGTPTGIALSTPSAHARLDSLTGVRFAAALIVFLYHAGHYLPRNELGAFGGGMTGVSLFYILSGFVMMWVFRTDDTPQQFYRRRFARIYPAYFVAVTAAVSVSVIMGDFAPTELTAYTLLQSWSPDPTIHYAASPVFWSLSCEAFFYMTFPLIAGRIHRATTRVVWGIVCAAVVAVLGIGAISSLYWDQDVVRWLAYIFPPTRCIEFVLGVALGLLVRRGFRSPVPLWAAGALSFGAVLLASVAPDGLKFAAVTLIPFMLLVLALADRDVAKQRTSYSSKLIVSLGIWSYCFYLIHAMIQGWFVRAGEFVGLTGPVAVALSLGASVVGAWLLHVVVERPAERLLRPARFSQVGR